MTTRPPTQLAPHTTHSMGGTIHADITTLIGNTPLVQLRGFDTGPCRLLVKLEDRNPGGSIKDRIGRSMIEAAEREGLINPTSVLVEATAGNTGLALAMVAASKGYRLILVIPDKMSHEKVLHIKALGAEVIITRSDVARGHPAHYIDLAAELAGRTPGAWHINQFANPANPLAHQTTTGPEIWHQTEGAVDAVVAGVGSGGTLTGLARYFAGVGKPVELVLADPVGSALAGLVTTGCPGPAGAYMVEGIGGGGIPPVADLSTVRTAYSISDHESFATARELLRRQGLLAGSSAGTLVAAALRYCQAQTQPKTVVTFLCDSGSKYLSKMYNDQWMTDQGFLPTPTTGDLREIISRRFADRTGVSVAPDDTLAVALNRLRLYDVSQLPVLLDHRVVGILDEGDVLLAVSDDTTGGEAFQRPVREVMTTRLWTVRPSDSLESLLAPLSSGLVAIVADEQGFQGLITRIDVLNYLRRRQRGTP